MRVEFLPWNWNVFQTILEKYRQKSQRKQCLEDESMWAINYGLLFFHRGVENKVKKNSKQFGIHDDMMTFTKENIHFFPFWWKLRHALEQKKKSRKSALFLEN